VRYAGVLPAASTKGLIVVCQSDDSINHPSHYKQGSIESIDYIEDQHLGFHEANIVKYIVRWRIKDGVQDLKKAEFYLKRLIALVEQATGE